MSVLALWGILVHSNEFLYLTSDFALSFNCTTLPNHISLQLMHKAEHKHIMWSLKKKESRPYREPKDRS